MRRISTHSDALCKFCGNPAANGLSDADGLWCENCGRIRAVMAFERVAFDLLRAYSWEEFDAAIEGVRAHDGTPDKQRSTQLAAQWRPIRNVRTWVPS